MRAREAYRLPPDKQEKLRRAVRLEWATIAFMISIIVLLYFTLGSSQAMKTAWFEDILSLVPPIAFLIARRVEQKEPNGAFPYGYHRAISIAHLCAALALLGMGAFLLFESSMSLIKAEHPTIGTMRIFGHQVWLGWVMIGALVYSVIPPVVLGRMKLPLAEELHDKVLHADADMNKADWLTGLAAIGGIIGIGFGLWWADVAAAALISLDVLHDGTKNLSSAVKDLMDRQPARVKDGEPDPLPDQIRTALRTRSWIGDADIRLREEGHVLTGEAFVVPAGEPPDLLALLEEAAREAEAMDWRLYDLAMVPVRSLPDPERGGGSRGGDAGAERAFTAEDR